MFPKFKLTGSPYEIGFTHGKLAKKQIENSIEVYRHIFKEFAGLSWEQAQNKAESYLKPIQEYDAAIMDEIKGIAAASGRSLNEIVALNARSEIMFTSKRPDGCTAVGLTSMATGGSVFIGQNWDWRQEIFNSLIVLEIMQENRPAITMITEAGIVGKFGMNSKGIGLCMNALVCEESIPGVPLHVIMRGILNAENTGGAVSAIVNGRIASAVNFLIGHKDGGVFNMEVTPSMSDALYPINGLIVHTNHFSSPVLKGRVEDVGKRIFPDSIPRYQIGWEQLQKKGKELGLADIKAMLANHGNYPQSICRHAQGNNDGKEIVTVFSFILDLTEGKIFIAPGRPCETDYEEV